MKNKFSLLVSCSLWLLGTFISSNTYADPDPGVLPITEPTLYLTVPNPSTLISTSTLFPLAITSENLVISPATITSIGSIGQAGAISLSSGNITINGSSSGQLTVSSRPENVIITPPGNLNGTILSSTNIPATLITSLNIGVLNAPSVLIPSSPLPIHASTVVPLPSAIWLFISGLGFLRFNRTRANILRR